MAADGHRYAHIHKLFCCGASWTGNAVKCALVNSSYVFDSAHTTFSQVSSYELTAGDGYTTGGLALSGKTATNTELDANDLIFTYLNKTFRGGVLYFDGIIDGLTNPLIYYLIFDNSPADVTVPSVNFNIVWNASGIITL